MICEVRASSRHPSRLAVVKRESSCKTRRPNEDIRGGRSVPELVPLRRVKVRARVALAKAGDRVGARARARASVPIPPSLRIRIL